MYKPWELALPLFIVLRFVGRGNKRRAYIRGSKIRLEFTTSFKFKLGGFRSGGAYCISLRRYYCYDCLDGNYSFKLILEVGNSVIVAAVSNASVPTLKRTRNTFEKLCKNCRTK